MSPEGRVVRQELNTRYHILKVDLTQARSKFEKQKLDGSFRELTVLQAPAAFSMKLSSQAYPEIPVAVGQTLPITDFEITEVFIKNEAGVGTAVLWLAGRKKEAK